MREMNLRLQYYARKLNVLLRNISQSDSIIDIIRVRIKWRLLKLPSPPQSRNYDEHDPIYVER